MRVLLVGSFDLHLHPYSEKYIRICKEQNIYFKFIYWNRSGYAIPEEDYFEPFDYRMDTYQSAIHKVNGYLKFYRFVRNYIRKEKFDKIVFFATQTMVIFSRIALKKYKGKFIFDFRDETYEKYGFYKNIVKKCILASKNTVISSPGFKLLFSDVADSKFVLCHNTKGEFKEAKIEKVPCDKIRISFWGMVRQPKYYEKVFKVFGNNDKYVLNFYGAGYEKDMAEIIENNHYSNIHLNGKYTQDMIPNFAANTDLLLNCYSNNSIQKNALTVKMYEAIEYGIPMIVQKDSYMDKYLYDNGIDHISIDFDNFEDDSNIDLSNKKSQTSLFIEEIRKDEDKFMDSIKLFIGE